MTELEWEKVSDGPVVCSDVYRAWVTNGWIIYIDYYGGNNSYPTTTFYPDPDHEWE
jgi:hypothetical protein